MIPFIRLTYSLFFEKQFPDGARQLYGFGDNGRQHGLQLERGVDSPCHLTQSAQLLHRLRKLSSARL